MCGIAGAIAPDHEATIRGMTDELHHRGPDDDGYYHGDRMSLGMRRLSIIDLKRGAQPI